MIGRGHSRRLFCPQDLCTTERLSATCCVRVMITITIPTSTSTTIQHQQDGHTRLLGSAPHHFAKDQIQLGELSPSIVADAQHVPIFQLGGMSQSCQTTKRDDIKVWCHPNDHLCNLHTFAYSTSCLVKLLLKDATRRQHHDAKILQTPPTVCRPGERGGSGR